MNAEDRVLDNSAEGKLVKNLGHTLPDGGAAVLFDALVVAAVHLCDLAAFVVAA